MKYIAHRRLKKDVLCGPVNIPAMTELECEDGIIIYNNGIVCYEDCETAHQFFTRNDDGHGMERGRLTQAIMRTLAKTNGRGDEAHQERWDRVWNDPACQPYKRADDDEYWLWNHAFFNADIGVLRHIAKLVGAKA